jgi:hypothetical protein
MRTSWLGLLLTCGLLAACASRTPVPATTAPTAAAPTSPLPTIPPTPAPTPIPPTLAPTVDPFFANQGGGEPRTAGYWLIWNSCAEGDKAGVAAANGGREAGWVILDDLLDDPGILLGGLPVETCRQGIDLLGARDVDGLERAGDAVYDLAAQLLAAQLNLAVGAEFCPAIEDSVRAGQLLLLSLEFDGSGAYLGPGAAPDDSNLALALAEQLRVYSTGALCR